MTARIITSFFAFIFLLTVTSYLLPTVFAQTPIPATPLQPAAYSLPPVVSPTSPLYTDLLLNNMFHSFSCLAIGSSVIGQPCLTYQVTKNAQGMIQSVPMLSQVNLSGGTLGAVSSLIGALYLNPPVRTADYLASVGQGLGIAKEARAQGVVGSGANVLSPIIKLWQVSRNVSYVIMIIIFVVIGLMVMFRQKINPQTVITAQAALPGLVIGLILITFSYFLAGLISDMAFVGTNVVGYYFSAAQGTTQNLVKDLSNQNIIAINSRFVGIIGPFDISHAVGTILNNLTETAQSFVRFAVGLMAFSYGNQIGHIVPFVGDLAGIVVGIATAADALVNTQTLLGLALAWISTAILLYSMLKLLIRLINSYLTIIFLTITAPFQFLAASLPGRQGIATGWVLNMLCNVLAFPAVMAVLYFVAYLLGMKGQSPFIISGQVGIIGGSTLPLLGGLDTRFINILLSFGALVALPAIPDVICRAIGKPGAGGQLLGQELAGNIRGGRGYSNQWQQTGQMFGKIGQDYTTFRGRPPGWSPAGDVNEFLEGKKIFGKERQLWSWLKPRPYKEPQKKPGAG